MKNTKNWLYTVILLFIVLLYNSCNKLPSEPSNPDPDHLDAGIDLSIDIITWECENPDNEKLSYEIYFDTIEEPIKIGNTDSTFYTLEPLIPNQNYYWKIAVINEKGKRVEGPVWNFKTGKKDGSLTMIEDNTLVIEGKDIWIRDYPVTGEVIMKLNTGDKCIILEKGKLDTIRDIIDNWYKIKYNGKEGWVFGSQTSVKQYQISRDINPEKDIIGIWDRIYDISEIDDTNLAKYKNLELYITDIWSSCSFFRFTKDGKYYRSCATAFTENGTYTLNKEVIYFKGTQIPDGAGIEGSGEEVEYTDSILFLSKDYLVVLPLGLFKKTDKE